MALLGGLTLRFLFMDEISLLRLSSPLGACDFALVYLISHFHGTFKDKEKTICILESKEVQMAETQAKKLLVKASPSASSGASFV